MGKTSQESRLLVDAHFGNALAGYFRAATDPTWRQHSLGVLAAATHRRGTIDHVNNQDVWMVSGLGLIAYRYRPTWGHGTEVSTIGVHSPDSGYFVLSTIALQHENVAPLHIVCPGPELDPTGEQEVINAHIFIGSKDSSHDLLKNPSATRDLITEQARHFFSTVATSLGVERLLLEAPTLPQ